MKTSLANDQVFSLLVEAERLGRHYQNGEGVMVIEIRTDILKRLLETARRSGFADAKERAALAIDCQLLGEPPPDVDLEEIANECGVFTLMEAAVRGTKRGIEERIRNLPERCVECGINYADPPSRLCPGCEAYREHTR